jgi:2-octaprenyl-6-methoxyphenol hydroxylase
LRRQDKPGDFAATVLREYDRNISRRRNQGYGGPMIDQPATSGRFDVVIAGAGPTGLAMALALTHMLEDDVSVALVDRGPAPAQPAAQAAPADPRAWALSNASKRFLEALGIWREVVPEAQPVTEIDITDSSLEAGVRPVLLHYENTTEEGEPAAWIVPNGALLAALRKAVSAKSPAVVTELSGAGVAGLGSSVAGRRVTLADGRSIDAELVIAADGRASALRKLAGIKTVRVDHDQVGIVTTVSFERSHGGKAVQHFLPGGPFAILPLPGNRACITWSEARATGEAIMAGDDDAFAAAVQRRFGGRLGPITVVGPRAAFPLATEIARGYVAPAFALVGDAAHAVHPIAGQGLNLAFRDCAALAECVAECAAEGLMLGHPAGLERYQRWRRFDSAVSAAVFGGLNGLFSNDVALVRSAREFGLGLVQRSETAKRFFINEAAGLSGDLPSLMR